MQRPPIEDLLQKINNRYILVNAVAKRSREINASEEKKNDNTTNALILAMEELVEGKLEIILP